MLKIGTGGTNRYEVMTIYCIKESQVNTKLLSIAIDVCFCVCYGQAAVPRKESG